MINGEDVTMKRIPFTQSVILSADEQVALARQVARGIVFKVQRDDAVETLERVSILADHMTTCLSLAIEAMSESGNFVAELDQMHATLACGHREAYPGEPVPGE